MSLASCKRASFSVPSSPGALSACTATTDRADKGSSVVGVCADSDGTATARKIKLRKKRSILLVMGYVTSEPFTCKSNGRYNLIPLLLLRQWLRTRHKSWSGFY